MARIQLGVKSLAQAKAYPNMSHEVADYVTAFLSDDLAPVQLHFGEHTHGPRLMAEIKDVGPESKTLLILRDGPTKDGQVLAVTGKLNKTRIDHMAQDRAPGGPGSTQLPVPCRSVSVSFITRTNSRLNAVREAPLDKDGMKSHTRQRGPRTVQVREGILAGAIKKRREKGKEKVKEEGGRRGVLVRPATVRTVRKLSPPGHVPGRVPIADT
ncbi:hypothetical protein F4821DRAFT_207893 [Hypoxylon rubiginosum]|uniref:Uncharacterized protein n=1 Tax=Hypoxylon rubiginosum TaxID=110542 RepID=A0ACC0CQ73_9PEZI|nr:hypothetical protein F4821DRAFT_207893 [Hypoxylon rubiginosum]